MEETTNTAPRWKKTNKANVNSNKLQWNVEKTMETHKNTTMETQNKNSNGNSKNNPMGTQTKNPMGTQNKSNGSSTVEEKINNAPRWKKRLTRLHGGRND